MARRHATSLGQPPLEEALLADHRLAARLENLCAVEMRRFVATARAVDHASSAACLEVAGGVAAFVGEGSPVNMAVGLGMTEPVTVADIAILERFFVERGARPLVGVCPLAHPSLAEALASRGWVLDGFEHVLVRRLDATDAFAETPAHIEIRQAQSQEDRALWAVVAATGFSYPLESLPEQLALGKIVVERPGAMLFIAWVDGCAAGTGELYAEDGVAWLSGDSTLPQFRGRGVQQALQRHRLSRGVANGCELAVTEAAPGSGSQRNMERAGFRVAYTRADMVAPRATDQTVSIEGITS